MVFVSNMETYDRWKYQDQIHDMKLTEQLFLHPSVNHFTFFTSFDYTKGPVSITPPDFFRLWNVRNLKYVANTPKKAKDNYLSRLPRGPSSIVLWSSKPEENVIANPQSVSPSDATTLLEELGITDKEFAPRTLKSRSRNDN